jgi:hypothetical protein
MNRYITWKNLIPLPFLSPGQSKHPWVESTDPDTVNKVCLRLIECSVKCVPGQRCGIGSGNLVSRNSIPGAVHFIELTPEDGLYWKLPSTQYL